MSDADRWVPTLFKGKEVFARVDEEGIYLAEEGRVEVRYSAAPGARIYRAGASRLAHPKGPPVELPPGVAAPDDGGAGAPARAPASPGRGFGSAGSRTAEQARAAREDALARIQSQAEVAHQVFTDGACRGNPGPAGAGVAARLVDGRRLEAARPLGHATNQVGELAAIALGLELLGAAGVDPADRVVVYTDSSYAHGLLTKGWKAKANQELVAHVRAALARWPRARVEWVAGHVGVAENERADRLAVGASHGETIWSP